MLTLKCKSQGNTTAYTVNQWDRNLIVNVRTIDTDWPFKKALAIPHSSCTLKHQRKIKRVGNWSSLWGWNLSQIMLTAEQCNIRPIKYSVNALWRLFQVLNWCVLPPTIRKGGQNPTSATEKCWLWQNRRLRLSGSVNCLPAGGCQRKEKKENALTQYNKGLTQRCVKLQA